MGFADHQTSYTDREEQKWTIDVTSFFRNDVAFQTLEGIVLPELFKNQHNLRIWSAGCATGEEPYSIAMLLLETLGTRVDEWRSPLRLAQDTASWLLMLTPKRWAEHSRGSLA